MKFRIIPSFWCLIDSDGPNCDFSSCKSYLSPIGYTTNMPKKDNITVPEKTTDKT